MHFIYNIIQRSRERLKRVSKDTPMQRLSNLGAAGPPVVLFLPFFSSFMLRPIYGLSKAEPRGGGNYYRNHPGTCITGNVLQFDYT